MIKAPQSAVKSSNYEYEEKLNSQIHRYFVHGNPSGGFTSDNEGGRSEEDLLGFRKEAALSRSFKSNKLEVGIMARRRKISPKVLKSQ
jgi:hypothetical protein